MRLIGEVQTQYFNSCTNNIEAYQLYLEGRYFLNKRTKEASKKAIESIQQAINIDGGILRIYSFIPHQILSDSLSKAKTKTGTFSRVVPQLETTGQLES